MDGITILNVTEVSENSTLLLVALIYFSNDRGNCKHSKSAAIY